MYVSLRNFKPIFQGWIVVADILADEQGQLMNHKNDEKKKAY
jgi:hypothetical protein